LALLVNAMDPQIEFVAARNLPSKYFSCALVFNYAFKPVGLWIIRLWFVASSRWLLRYGKRGPDRTSLS
jgi:hypothetical protein